MSESIDRSNLGYLGLDFQFQLAKILVEDPHFYREVKNIVDHSAFTNILLREFVKIVIDYYDKWDSVPSYQSIQITFHERAKTTTQIEEYDELIKRIKETSLSGVEDNKTRALRFFKQQGWLKISNEIRDAVIKGGDESYDKCAKMIESLSMVGNEDEYGFSPYDIKDEALSLKFSVPIPTGVSRLDEALNGGLAKGKMGIIIGSAGFGKSTFSTAIAAYASTYKCEINDFKGYKVLQIYFEDDNVDITRKHFSRITQVEARYLSRDDDTRREINDTLEKYPDKELFKENLRLKKYHTGTKRASDIESFIKSLTNTGFKPDMVIIDYFECLLPERTGYTSDSEWTREGITMRRLEKMASDLDIALWIPTQGNKGSIASSDLVTMDQAGGSIKKVQIAHVVISIARSIEDIDNSKATLAILKNRAGKSGQVFQSIKFDNGTSTISCDEVTTYDNSLLYKEHQEKFETAQMNAMAKEILAAQKLRNNQIPVSNDF